MKTPLELALDTLADAIAGRLLERIGSKLPAAQRLVDVRGACKLLSCSRKGVLNKVASGELRAVRIDRRLRFDVRDLDGLIEDGKSE